jgi:hypothetical protein
MSFVYFPAELGDSDPELHLGNYAAEYEVVARQSPELEEKAMELHQKLKGLTPSEADTLFLKKAATLDTYGVDPHPVKVLYSTKEKVDNSVTVKSIVSPLMRLQKSIYNS